MPLATSTSTSHCKRRLECRSKGRSRKGYGLRDMCYVSSCLLACPVRCTGTTRAQAAWPWQLFFRRWRSKDAYATNFRQFAVAPDLKKFVASIVSLTACTVNPFLFDLLWQSVLQKLASVDVDWEAYVSEPVKEEDRKPVPPDKTSSKTSNLVSVAGFPWTVPVTVPGWFLFLLSPVPVTTFRNSFCYSPKRGPVTPRTRWGVIAVNPRDWCYQREVAGRNWYQLGSDWIP